MSGLPWPLFFFSISPTSESCFIALLIVRSLRPSFSTSCFRLYVIYKRPVSFSIQLFLFLQKQCRDLVKAEIFSLCIVKIVQSHLFFSSLFFSNVKGNILERDLPLTWKYMLHTKSVRILPVLLQLRHGLLHPAGRMYVILIFYTDCPSSFTQSFSHFSINAGHRKISSGRK